MEWENALSVYILMNKWMISKDIAKIIAGSLIFAISLNYFLIPVHVYSAGFMGIAQLLRDLILHITGVSIPFDIAGLLNFLLNSVIFLFAYHYISRHFALMTLATIAIQTLFLTLLPVPFDPVLREPIVSILFGSSLCAFGTVITFNGKGSGGGIDVIGIYLSQNNRGSVGGIYLLVNTSIYALCLIFYDFETAVYSIISSTLLSFLVDHIHKQNIEVELMIFTSKCDDLKEEIFHHAQRGITCWNGYGGYTDTQKEVLLSVVTKDKVPCLINMIQRRDPDAFVIVSNSIQVYGNFKKKIV